MTEDQTMEAALAATEEHADQALRAASALTRELRRAKASAGSGQVRDLRRALDAAADRSTAAVEATRAMREGFDFDEQHYLASGGYLKELLAAAAAEGVEAFEEDERILSYPSLVRLVAGDAALEIDRRRERRLRPSVVVRLLAGLQNRAPRFRPPAFLEAVCKAYDLVVAEGGKQADAVVRLVDVWSTLTLLPGQAREYSKQEFARDLYLLDQSGETSAKDGRRLRWSASTGTKGAGVLTTVARGGQPQRYWGIAFAASPAEAARA